MHAFFWEWLFEPTVQHKSLGRNKLRLCIAATALCKLCSRVHKQPLMRYRDGRQPSCFYNQNVKEPSPAQSIAVRDALASGVNSTQLYTYVKMVMVRKVLLVTEGHFVSG
jgi:hypothetical protein